MAFQSMIDNGMKKKQRQNKALIDEISATIMLQDYLNRKTFKWSLAKITTNIFLLKWFISQNLYFFEVYKVSFAF
jgi:hypothetical protein